MRVLESIEVRGGRRIDLGVGDLTDLARNEWFDTLVVSAVKGDYTPSQSSLIGALHRKDVSVAGLAEYRVLDYTKDYGTWLSQPVHVADPGIGFGRVLCFEPTGIGPPPEVVGHFFRALVPILAERPEIRSMAMPILATGDMGYSIDEMLPPLLDAATNMLARGLPLDRIAIVVRNDERAAVARQHFLRARSSTGEYDVFVSYSQKDAKAAEDFTMAFTERQPDMNVFVDRLEIDHGAAWQRRVFDRLDRSRRVVALLTRDYLASEICLEEFNIAWMRTRDTGRAILLPLYVGEAELPTWMRSRQYIDCRESDPGKLAGAAVHIADGLR